MKTMKECKYIDILMHILTTFVMLLPILIVMLPCFIAVFNEGLQLTTSNIDSIWTTAIADINTNFFGTLFNNTAIFVVVDDTLQAFNISNLFLANIITYWVLIGAICLLFNMIMKMFTYIISLITPQPKRK